MRLIDANLAMRKIREYMEDYPNATARLAACRACLSILGDKQLVPTIDPETMPIVQELQAQVKEQKEKLACINFGAKIDTEI